MHTTKPISLPKTHTVITSGAEVAAFSQALSSLGPFVESNAGHARFLAVYAISAISGSLASYMFSPNPSVGASGAMPGSHRSILRFPRNGTSACPARQVHASLRPLHFGGRRHLWARLSASPHPPQAPRRQQGLLGGAVQQTNATHGRLAGSCCQDLSACAKQSAARTRTSSLGDLQVMLKSLGQSLLINLVIGFTVPSIDNWCGPQHAASCSGRPELKLRSQGTSG